MKRCNRQFGPWTTTLHHGSRLELSAFWRRRLDRLGSLADKRPRMRWWSLLLLGVLVGVLVSVPQLRMDAARAEEPVSESAASGAKPQAADEAPFTATFSNGVKVQLVGWSENPSKGKPWWAPDGSALEEPPYTRVPAIMHAGENQLAREVCFRWTNLPEDPDFENGWDMRPPIAGMGGGNAYDTKGKRLEDLTAWAVIVPKAPDTCAVQFSVSVLRASRG